MDQKRKDELKDLLDIINGLEKLVETAERLERLNKPEPAEPENGVPDDLPREWFIKPHGQAAEIPVDRKSIFEGASEYERPNVQEGALFSEDGDSDGVSMDPVKELHVSELFEQDLPKVKGYIVAAVTDIGTAVQIHATGLDAGNAFAILGADLAERLARGTGLSTERVAGMLNASVAAAVAGLQEENN